MTDVESITNLASARAERDFRAALQRLDTTAKHEGIDADGYLGRYHTAVMVLLEQLFVFLMDDRERRNAANHAHEERLVQSTEAAQDVAETHHQRALTELDKLERMSAKAKADAQRMQATLEDDATKLVASLSADLVVAIGEGNVIRAKAYNRRERTKDVIAGVAIVLLVLVCGIVIDRLFFVNS